MHPDPVKGRLLDGETARPDEVTVSFGADGLYITGARTSLRIPFKDIRDIHRAGNELQVSLPPAASGGNEPVLLLSADLEEYFSAALHRHTSGTLKWKFSLHRIPGRFWLVAALIVLPAGYWLCTSGAAHLHILVPHRAEAAMGDYFFKSFVTDSICTDAVVQHNLEKMASQLVPGDSPYTYTFTVVTNTEVNAFALPGGHIVVNAGLLAKCESPGALAGVLAHEISHVELRHGLKALLRSLGITVFISATIGGGVEQLEMLENITELSGIFVFLKYSREAEREADKRGIDLMHGKSFSVEGWIDIFNYFEKEFGSDKGIAEWVSSHPVTSERILMLEKARETETFHPRAWIEALEAPWADFHKACGVPEESTP